MKKVIIILSLILLPLTSFASFDTSIKYGSKGEPVIELQDFLQDQTFYTGTLDGRFGFGTLKAVKAFQWANGLKVDGYFGKASRFKANEILNNLLLESNKTEMNENIINEPVITPIVNSPTVEIPISPVVDNLEQIENLKSEYRNEYIRNRGYGDLITEYKDTSYETLYQMLDSTDLSNRGQSIRARLNVAIKLKKMADQLQELGATVPTL